MQEEPYKAEEGSRADSVSISTGLTVQYLLLISWCFCALLSRLFKFRGEGNIWCQLLLRCLFAHNYTQIIQAPESASKSSSRGRLKEACVGCWSAAIIKCISVVYRETFMSTLKN